MASVVTVAVSVGAVIGLCGSASAQPVAAGHHHRDQIHHRAQLPVQQKANRAANIALAQIGDPYRWGATGPGQFDCSGLAMWSYDHAHLSLPRTAAEQYAAVRHESRADMMRGDLVFFHDSRGHVYHVGIFL